MKFAQLLRFGAHRLPEPSTPANNATHTGKIESSEENFTTDPIQKRSFSSSGTMHFLRSSTLVNKATPKPNPQFFRSGVNGLPKPSTLVTNATPTVETERDEVEMPKKASMSGMTSIKPWRPATSMQGNQNMLQSNGPTTDSEVKDINSINSNTEKRLEKALKKCDDIFNQRVRSSTDSQWARYTNFRFYEGGGGGIRDELKEKIKDVLSQGKFSTDQEKKELEKKVVNLINGALPPSEDIPGAKRNLVSLLSLRSKRRDRIRTIAKDLVDSCQEWKTLTKDIDHFCKDYDVHYLGKEGAKQRLKQWRGGYSIANQLAIIDFPKRMYAALQSSFAGKRELDLVDASGELLQVLAKACDPNNKTKNSIKDFVCELEVVKFGGEGIREPKDLNLTAVLKNKKKGFDRILDLRKCTNLFVPRKGENPTSNLGEQLDQLGQLLSLDLEEHIVYLPTLSNELPPETKDKIMKYVADKVSESGRIVWTPDPSPGPAHQK
jgi:hypothetical protein